MDLFSRTLADKHYENAHTIIGQMRKSEGFAGDLPPVTTAEYFNDATHFDLVWPLDAWNGLK